MNAKIQLVMSQTNYGKELAEAKLLQHQLNEMSVIREYLGAQIIPLETQPPRSVQQEMYKQMRTRMQTNVSSIDPSKALNQDTS